MSGVSGKCITGILSSFPRFGFSKGNAIQGLILVELFTECSCTNGLHHSGGTFFEKVSVFFCKFYGLLQVTFQVENIKLLHF